MRGDDPTLGRVRWARAMLVCASSSARASRAADAERTDLRGGRVSAPAAGFCFVLGRGPLRASLEVVTGVVPDRCELRPPHVVCV